ncbi:MAG: tetratricopeptide repeat protein, partial [Nitrospira sp.]|nr:tetratricopeptide repeat protein [Nitrospira sp.]
MKQYLLIFILFLVLAGCSDSTLNSKSSYDQGVALAVAGQFNKAQKAFTKALQDEADRDAARQSLEVVRESLSQRLDTQAVIDFFQGIKFGNEGEQVLAFSYFSKAIKRAPDFATAYYERGIINGRLKLYDQAVTDFSRSIELNPQDGAAYNNRGLARAKGLKEYNNAIADFTKAVELDPKFAEAYDNRAIAYRMASDDKEKACADWKKACELT